MKLCGRYKYIYTHQVMMVYPPVEGKGKVSGYAEA